jgi:hypothetical protein
LKEMLSSTEMPAWGQIVVGLLTFLRFKSGDRRGSVRRLPKTCVHAAITVLVLSSLGIMVGCGQGSGSSKTTTITRTVTRPERPPHAAREQRTRLVDYTATLYDARIPDGWTVEKDETDMGGFVRSVWRDPADQNTSVTIDVVDGETDAPSDKASSVRADTSSSPSYEEIAVVPTSLGGRSAEKWVFRISGDQRVDYFMNDCSIGVAVLGSTSPSRYSSRSTVFRSVAASVVPDCAAVASEQDTTPTEPPPDSGNPDCDPSYPDFCIPPPPPDLDCSEVNGTDFTVEGDDPHGFDADGDGIGCESY